MLLKYVALDKNIHAVVYQKNQIDKQIFKILLLWIENVED